MPRSADLSEVDPNHMSSDVVDATLDIWGVVGKRSQIRLTGKSMRPLFRAGDLILIQHGSEVFRRGDVIVFRMADQIVVHRLLDIHADQSRSYLLTKGDSVLRPDPRFSSDQVIGRVIGFTRNGQEVSVSSPVWQLVGRSIASIELLGLKVYRTCSSTYKSLSNLWRKIGSG